MNNIITVDANIGAGKTTLLKYMMRLYDITIDLEPVDDWKPYLKKIYEENKGYADIQYEVWKRSWIQPKTENLMLMERSPKIVNETFLEIHHNNGNIGDEDYDLLKRMYERTHKQWKPVKYIYLRVSPEVCFEHIQVRDRDSENKIPFEYIKEIHDYHESAIQKLRECGEDVCIIEGDNKSVEQTAKDLLSYIGLDSKKIATPISTNVVIKTEKDECPLTTELKSLSLEDKDHINNDCIRKE